MVVRHFGGGIGHLASRVVGRTPTIVSSPTDSEEEEEDSDREVEGHPSPLEDSGLSMNPEAMDIDSGEDLEPEEQDDSEQDMSDSTHATSSDEESSQGDVSDEFDDGYGTS